MGFWKRLKNALTGGTSEADVATLKDDKLAEWLGIDRDNPEAIAETTYFTCLKILSETMGKLPLKFYKEDDTGGRVRAPTIGDVDIVLNRPNAIMTPVTFWSTMEFNCNHFGNGYAWIQREYRPSGNYGGTLSIKSIWPMQSDCVTVYIDDVGIFGDAGNLYYHYTDPRTGKLYIFNADDVIHIKTWMTWDGVLGKSVRDILKTTIQGAGYSQKYLEKLYKSGLTASSVLQYTGDLDSAKQTALAKKYNEILTGVKNAGKVVPIPVGMTLNPLNYKLTDAQFFELKKYTALQIAAAFGIEPNQINNYEKSSYASSEAQQLDFLTSTMLFRLAIYEQELNYKLLTASQREEGYLYKFNEKVLLRADAHTQIESITSGVQNGVYTPNEGRHLLDLPSRDGGDQLIVNGNYVPLTSVGAAYGVNEKGGSDE